MPDLTDAGQDAHALVLQLRRRRVTIDEIAKHLHISRADALELWRAAIAEVPVSQQNEYLAEELLLTDDAIRDLLAIARDHNRSPRTSVEAWNSVRGWAEHKAKLLGLDKTGRPADAPPSQLAAFRAKRRA